MKTATKVTAQSIMALIESQQFRCALTGRELTPETASLDHVVPLSKGGPHDLGNVWVVDSQVNQAKGDMTVEEFVQMCREVVAVADSNPS